MTFEPIDPIEPYLPQEHIDELLAESAEGQQ